MCKTLHKNLLLSINIGYITVENLGHQCRSPIQGSVFSASSVATICENEDAHSANNICTQYKIVYKALEDNLLVKAALIFLVFFTSRYLLFGSFVNYII